MKHHITHLLSFAAMFACAYTASIFAQEHYPTATVTIQVVGEDGNPLVGFNVGSGFEIPNKNGVGTSAIGAQGVTNKEGRVTITRPTANGFVYYGSWAEGYYRTSNLTYQFKAHKDGQWTPSNPTLRVVLKRVGDPVPMYARKVATEIPAVDQVIGFDLMIGDWVIPHGKGLRGDLLCKVVRRFVNWKDHDVALEITFPNEKDGLAPIIEKTPPTRGSELRLPRTAPEDGYRNKLATAIRRQPGGPSNEDAKTEMNYFFRVRTVLDEKGDIKSALYGKMHGDIRLDPINSKTSFIIFDSYLNPTPNDRNVEWDRSRNLATGLSDEQRPSAP
ncbi:MAG TPA: Ig-like domain-containing protein [Prosthecobacter sp.]|nr:Ig-like domain-containing protein [Prosthecobacter sp.]